VIKSQTSDSQEANNNKRNPKKVISNTKPVKRSTRNRVEVDYNEKPYEEFKFRKPTPTKTFKRYKDDEDSELSNENATYAIAPPRASRNLVRITSSSIESDPNSINLRRSNRVPPVQENQRATRSSRRRDVKQDEKENESLEHVGSLERVEKSQTSDKRSRYDSQDFPTLVSYDSKKGFKDIINGLYRRKQSSVESDFGPVYKEESEECEQEEPEDY
jgi:hypothetical protein